MLISQTRRFIFIHVPKAGGTSIEAALGHFQDEAYANLFDRHCLARDLCRVLQRWDRYFSFGFVRNPWDYHVSLYQYVLDAGPRHPEWQEVSAHKSFRAYCFDYLRPKYDFTDHSGVESGEVRAQSDFLLDMNDRPLVNFVGRFETLEKDFADVCQKLHLAPLKLPHLNRSSHTNYRDFF
jgi:hypothetical protein